MTVGKRILLCLPLICSVGVLVYVYRKSEFINNIYKQKIVHLLPLDYITEDGKVYNSNYSGKQSMSTDKDVHVVTTEVLTSLYLKNAFQHVTKRNFKHNHREHVRFKKLTKPSSDHFINYVSLNYKGRLGNLLFQYASLIGIAKHLNFTPVIDENFPLRRIFEVSVPPSKPMHNVKQYNEKKGCVFEKEAFKLDSRYNWTLDGYFQSWKYFTQQANQLRKEFAFKRHISTAAKKQFKEIISRYNVSENQTTFVAVHVRRGDMVHSKHMVKYGYTAADVGYIRRAMESFTRNYTHIFYIVSSDDIPWCSEHLKQNNTGFILQQNSPEIDMAIMSNCHHTITTTGSYGWWMAWLIGGTTIYYKDYPVPGSNLAKEFNSDDYRPPHWIAM